ncbi:PREDICTED: E3 ubiquitin-protein ligase RNF216-like [Priapulus caudatus]|uniref:E3 ubiquitin-protein ligase RNF216-like n=1 Tax=Priapulus caudatus TaxID=37621 RepID=A0ABM1EWT4_PRICU|nr:PREDICTED: E3 ubiquitin-protein ligase RNF216-like [Priapulus caudatus]
MLINERNWLRENNSQSKAAMESAVAAGNDEDEDEGEAMECGCCYCEVTFERMVQCSLGHLFCEECLRRYAKEAVYGQGKVALRCMGDGCSAGFPLSQLRKALPRMLMDKYEERQVEESISLAGLADLVRCPNCDFAAILPGDSKVFLCQTVDCMMISYQHFCPHTREPGKPCTSCTACSLWTNPDEDEDRAIRELKAEAQETRAAQGFVQDKEFGPPPEVTTHKKQKTA